MAQRDESDGEAIIVGPWTQAGRNLNHYFGSLISQINIVQNDINAANTRLRAERNAYREQWKETNDKYIELANLRLVLEQKVLRLEEAVSLLTKEKSQVAQDLVDSDSSRKQLRDAMRSSSHQYERLIEDLTRSENDLFHMKHRFSQLATAYQESTGKEPPPYVPPTEEDEDGPDSSLLQEHKNMQQQRKEMLAKLTKKNQAANSQEAALQQEQAQRRPSPVRQTRATNAGRAEPKLRIIPTPPVLNLDGATIEEPPVSHNQRNNKGKQPATTNPTHARAGPSSGRSPNKPVASSSSIRAAAKSRYPAFLLNAETSPSTSRQAQVQPQQPQSLLPAAHIQELNEHDDEPREIAAPKTSNANLNVRHRSIVVQTHVQNALQRRKLTDAVDANDARIIERANQERELKRARKAAHRAFIEERAREMQIEMGVDLGDFPPEGMEPQRRRWTTMQIGEPMTAPRYKTPPPIVKQEPRDVQIHGRGHQRAHPQAQHHPTDPGTSAAHRRAAAQTPRRGGQHQEEEDDEEELYYKNQAEADAAEQRQRLPQNGRGDEMNEENMQAMLRSQDQLQFPPSQRVEYRFTVPANMSTAGATDGSEGSTTSKKSKLGERHGAPEEDAVDEDHQKRPTKRRRLGTQQPTAPPHAHTGQQQQGTSTAAQNGLQQHSPKRRSSARLTERRIQAAAQAQAQPQDNSRSQPHSRTTRQHLHQQQQQQQQQQGEAGPGPGTTAARRQAAIRGTGRMLRGAAAGSQAEQLRRQAEREWMRGIPEAEPEEPVQVDVPPPGPVPGPGPFGPAYVREVSEDPAPPAGVVPDAEVPEDGDAASGDDDDPIAGDYMPRQRNPILRVAADTIRSQLPSRYRANSPRPKVHKAR